MSVIRRENCMLTSMNNKTPKSNKPIEGLECLTMKRLSMIDSWNATLEQRYYHLVPNIKKVIFSGNKTIVLWDDDVKTIVTCSEDDVFDKEKGIALCYMKRMMGNKSKFNDEINKWIGEPVHISSRVPETLERIEQNK